MATVTPPPERRAMGAAGPVSSDGPPAALPKSGLTLPEGTKIQITKAQSGVGPSTSNLLKLISPPPPSSLSSSPQTPSPSSLGKGLSTSSGASKPHKLQQILGAGAPLPHSTTTTKKVIASLLSPSPQPTPTPTPSPPPSPPVYKGPRTPSPEIDDEYEYVVVQVQGPKKAQAAAQVQKSPSPLSSEGLRKPRERQLDFQQILRPNAGGKLAEVFLAFGKIGPSQTNTPQYQGVLPNLNATFEKLHQVQTQCKELVEQGKNNLRRADIGKDSKAEIRKTIQYLESIIQNPEGIFADLLGLVLRAEEAQELGVQSQKLTSMSTVLDKVVGKLDGTLQTLDKLAEIDKGVSKQVEGHLMFKLLPEDQVKDIVLSKKLNDINTALKNHKPLRDFSDMTPDFAKQVHGQEMPETFVKDFAREMFTIKEGNKAQSFGEKVPAPKAGQADLRKAATLNAAIAEVVKKGLKNNPEFRDISSDATAVNSLRHQLQTLWCQTIFAAGQSTEVMRFRYQGEDPTKGHFASDYGQGKDAVKRMQERYTMELQGTTLIMKGIDYEFIPPKGDFPSRAIGYDAVQVEIRVDLSKMKKADLLLTPGCVTVKETQHGFRERFEDIRFP